MAKAVIDNLCAIISTYHVNITQSRYRTCIIYLFFLGVTIVSLVSLSPFKRADTYLLILVLLFFSIIFIGVMNSAKHGEKLLRSFILTDNGVISFSDEQSSYQLLTHSRFSFFGCWLMMKPSTENNSATERANISFKVKSVFIFRDSLNGQDFARLARVITRLS